MFLCGACHEKVCKLTHVFTGDGPCDRCGRAAECVDCGPPKSDQDVERKYGVKNWAVQMYLHCGRLEYRRGSIGGGP